MDQIMIAHSGNIQKTDYEYEVIVYEPKFRKYAFSLAGGLRNSGIKTELIPKKKEIDIDEYKKFKLDDGASKVTYVSKDGAVIL